MGMLESMNEALQYIEENLADDITMKKVAKLAFCSEYHLSECFLFWQALRFRNIFGAGGLLWQHSNLPVTT
jgi:AraC-like DNA-binding protein